VKKRYPRNFDQIASIVEDTERFFQAENIDGSLRMKVDLALEELFVNMVTYNTESDEAIEIEMKPIAERVDRAGVPRGGPGDVER
jgi:anti-sigma regulatory factor (Ser/Thr protein kinase)